MKAPQPEQSNVRIVRFAKRVIFLPFVALVALYAWAKGRLRGFKSAETLHAEDKLRQSRARRTLRGLPPDHVPGPPGASETPPP